jgi:glycosyltransferase involved in cell wall biosynthesis
MAAGRPVIAYAAGGALDTVIEGRTGLFFREPAPEALGAAVEQLEALTFDPARIRRHAERFGRPLFEQQLAAFVDQQMEAFRRGEMGLLREDGFVA